MKILILSDIHAMSRELEEISNTVEGFPDEYSLEGVLGYRGGSGGNFKIEDRSNMTNPVLSVTRSLDSFKEDIDLLLCLGDITHQAKKAPLMSAWHDIHRIANELGIREVIGLTGNHDIASRSSSTRDIQDIRDFLPAIYPRFPSNDDQFNTKYYADGVSSKTIEGCLVVILDTCRLHGLGHGAEAGELIFQNGHLTKRMIEQVIEEIEQSDSSHVLVAMHHHPLPIEEDNENPIENGKEFLNAIGSTKKNILVVHGHTHQPFLHSVNSGTPIVFGSGTFAAYPFQVKGKQIANLFHIVDFDQSCLDKTLGKVLSWERGAADWERSRRTEIPHEIYFGASISLTDLANKLAQFEKKSFMKDALDQIAPELKYVTYDQLEEINNLISNCGFKLIFEHGELIAMIYEETI